MSDLCDRVALVTGASRGIGRAVALALAQRGAAVAVNYHTGGDAAAAVVAAIEDGGGRAVALQADVSVPEEARSLVARTIEELGGLDVLVNNAGIARDNLLLRLSEEDWRAVIETNLSAAFYCIKAAQRHMLRQRRGRIINIGSVVGLSGNAGQANYASAKAGLVGLTKAVARELGSRGITANLVAPGYIETDMTAALPAEYTAKALERITLGRLGRPEDVAAAVAFLVSDAAAYITGQVLCVDGGMAM